MITHSLCFLCVCVLCICSHNSRGHIKALQKGATGLQKRQKPSWLLPIRGSGSKHYLLWSANCWIGNCLTNDIWGASWRLFSWRKALEFHREVQTSNWTWPWTNWESRGKKENWATSPPEKEVVGYCRSKAAITVTVNCLYFLSSFLLLIGPCPVDARCLFAFQ